LRLIATIPAKSAGGAERQVIKDLGITTDFERRQRKAANVATRANVVRLTLPTHPSYVCLKDAIVG
jgi:hypothetical protein